MSSEVASEQAQCALAASGFKSGYKPLESLSRVIVHELEPQAKSPAATSRNGIDPRHGCQEARQLFSQNNVALNQGGKR